MNNDPGTLPTSSGIQLGDGTSGENVSDNMISLQMTSNNSGAVNFTYDAGGNRIRIIGYQSSGTKYFGTAPASDDIDLVVTGVSGANIHQHPRVNGYVALLACVASERSTKRIGPLNRTSDGQASADG